MLVHVPDDVNGLVVAETHVLENYVVDVASTVHTLCNSSCVFISDLDISWSDLVRFSLPVCVAEAFRDLTPIVDVLEVLHEVTR